MHDIEVRNIKAVDGYRAVRLLSSLESPMYNINIDGIYGDYRQGAILFSTYYDKDSSVSS